MGKRPPVPSHVAGGWLDFDDLCAELRQQFATERTSDPLGQLKDADAGEREVDHAHGWRVTSEWRGIYRGTRGYRKSAPARGCLRRMASVAG